MPPELRADKAANTEQKPDMGNNPAPLDLPAETKPAETSAADALPPSKDAPKEDQKVLFDTALQAHLEKQQLQLEQEWQKRLQELEKTNTEKLAQIEKDKKELEEYKKKIELERNQNLSSEEKHELRFKELEESNKRLLEQLELTTKESAERIRKSELAAFREKRIAQEGVHLTELVTGDTQEEIEASIAQCKQREAALFAEIERRAKEEAFKAIGQNIPQPLAPSTDLQQPQNTNELSTHTNRRDLASIRDPRQYKQERLKRLQSVRQATGLR